MKIDFTKEQFKVLMELVYLGDSIVNDFNVPSEIEGKYEGIENYIYSFCSHFGYRDYVDYSNEYDVYFPTYKFDKEVERKIQNYDENVFYRELVNKLAKRDAKKKFKQKINQDNLTEFLRLQFKIEEKYDNELLKNDLENVKVDIRENNVKKNAVK
ncbi:hypothetical protein [Clostridium sp. JN-1]|uniref:hypothetical protein n=1 Tax=Clostridium sp. JN-1 TaxID=2483110 RepID=UPI000F0B90CB|nr:hypothetical protein [Clostridium sp. JN-1]